MDFLNLVAKITLDQSEYETGLRGLAGKAGKTLGTVAKVGAAAIAAGGAAVVAITKQAIDGYAEYEQLAGGIETLYTDMEGGTKAVDAMMQHASEAWKTSGMSANEYMTTAIESSAALINALGGDTEKAAEMMDMSITDMSDNVNKMGTSMEAIQNAYRGFSRGNFTMLDNLALGFAGTKEGMQQLLDKAKEYAAQNGEIRDFSIDSYADIVDAIHIVQTEMGITGTTAKEASETIQGSLNAMKAAWTNLITGIADDNADLDKLMDNFVNSVNTVGKNIIPRIKTILKGATKIINLAVKDLLPMVIGVIVDSLPELTTAGIELITALLTGIAQAIPQLIAAIPSIVEALVTALQENWPAIQKAGEDILKALALGIADGIWYAVTAMADGLNEMDGKLAEFGVKVDAKLNEIGQSLSEMLSKAGDYIEEGLEQFGEDVSVFFGDIFDGTKEFYEELTSGLGEFIRKRVETLTSYYQAGKQRVEEFGNSIKQLFKDGMQWLYDHTIGKVVEIKDEIELRIEQFKLNVEEFVDGARNWGRDLMLNFWDGVMSKWNTLKDGVKGIAQGIKNFLGFSEPKEGPLSDFHTYAPDMMALFAKGIKDNEHLITDQIKSSFDFGHMTVQGGAVGGSTSNTYNITVNGIEELDEMLRWFESRQVRARMA